MVNHKVQSQAQTMSIMNNFSSTNQITFLPWKKESVAIRGNSGILKEFWAQIILQCILPPALHKVTTASRTSNNVDCILADLQCHYADLPIAISTLTQCHIALGPIQSTLQRSSTLSHKITQPDSGRLCCTDGLFRHSWSNRKSLLTANMPDIGGSSALQNQDG